MAKIAYLARPVDQAGASPELHKVCERIDQDLRMAGYHVYRPAEAWRTPIGTDLSRRLELVNRLALEGADLLVAYLPSGVASIGVPMEIEAMVSTGRPVIVITDIESYALQREGVTLIEGTLGSELAGTIALVEQTHPWFCGQVIRERSPHPHGALKLVIRGGHEAPRRAYPDDAGIDLTCVTEYTINPGAFVDVHTQVDAVQLPDNHWGMITGRSSTLRRWGLHVPVAVIDPGWRGPLFVGVWNLGKTQVRVEPGMRLGQLILVPNNPAPTKVVEKVDEAPRGLAGFGSTDGGMPA